jgi:hypothetical protein
MTSLFISDWLSRWQRLKLVAAGHAAGAAAWLLLSRTAALTAMNGLHGGVMPTASSLIPRAGVAHSPGGWSSRLSSRSPQQPSHWDGPAARGCARALTLIAVTEPVPAALLAIYHNNPEMATEAETESRSSTASGEAPPSAQRRLLSGYDQLLFHVIAAMP